MLYFFFFPLFASVLAYKNLLTDFTFIKGQKLAFLRDEDPLIYQKISYLVHKRIIHKYEGVCLPPYLPIIKYLLIGSLNLPKLEDQFIYLLTQIEANSEGVINDLPLNIPPFVSILIPPEIKVFISEDFLYEFLELLRIQNHSNIDCAPRIDAIVLESFNGDRLKLNLFKDAIAAYGNFVMTQRFLFFLPPQSQFQIPTEIPHASKDSVVQDWVNWHLNTFIKMRDSFFAFRFGINKGTLAFCFYYLTYIQKLSSLSRTLPLTQLSTIHVELIGFISEYLKFARKFPQHKREIAKMEFDGWLRINGAQRTLHPTVGVSELSGGYYTFTQIYFYFVAIKPEIFRMVKGLGLNSHEHYIMRHYFSEKNEISIFTTNPRHNAKEFKKIINAINTGGYKLS
jgi:hypothetical protein